MTLTTSSPSPPHKQERAVPTMSHRVTAVAQLYQLAGRICQFAEMRYIIEVGSTFGMHIVNHLSGAIFVGIMPQDGRPTSTVETHNTRVVRTSFSALFNLDDDILAAAVIIWPAMDADLAQYPGMAQKMTQWLNRVPYALLSHSASFAPGSEGAFRKILSQVGARDYNVGRAAPPGAKGADHWMALGGSHAVYRAPDRKISALAIISCYNDLDIISSVIKHLAQEGVQMYFIDNWSEDGTWEFVDRLTKVMPEHVVGCERYPKAAKDKQYNWFEILERKEVVATQQPHDWFIHYDSDELRSSCWPGVSLIDGLSFVDSKGYNVVNHFVMDFRPTKDGFCDEDDAKSFFTHFERNKVEANALQLKAWKKQKDRVMLSPSGGHMVMFAGRRVYPLCFTLAHYSLRSTAQARRKIYQERLPRVIEESAKRRYHGHYRRYTQEAWVLSDFLWREQDLILFEPKTFYADYLMPRLSGDS